MSDPERHFGKLIGLLLGKPRVFTRMLIYEGEYIREETDAEFRARVVRELHGADN